MLIRSISRLIFLAGLAGAAAGCASASSATSSTVSYIRGDARATLGCTPPQAADATLAAAQELQLTVDAHSADGLLGSVFMHGADGTKIEVAIKAEPDDKSDLKVRVGTFGDKVLQQHILEKIEAHLSTSKTAPVMNTAPAPVMNSTPAPANPLSP